MIYSIRIGFLLAILSVIVGAGIYQGWQPSPKQIIERQVKLPHPIISKRSFTYVAPILKRIQFNADNVVLGPGLRNSLQLPLRQGQNNSSPVLQASSKELVALFSRIEFKDTQILLGTGLSLKTNSEKAQKITLPLSRTIFVSPKKLRAIPSVADLKKAAMATRIVINNPGQTQFTIPRFVLGAGLKKARKNNASVSTIKLTPDADHAEFKNNSVALGAALKPTVFFGKTYTQFSPSLTSWEVSQAIQSVSSQAQILSVPFQSSALPTLLPLKSLLKTRVVQPSGSPVALSVPVVPIAVQSAALMGDVGHTQLVLRLTQKPFYTLSTDSSLQVITLAIDNVSPDLSSIPPLDTQGTAIQNIAFNVTPDNQFLVTLTLLPKMEVQGLRFINNNLVVDVGLGSKIPYVPTQNMASSASGSVQPLIITPVPLSSDELATQNYAEAVDLLNQGNADGAMGLLEMLVSDHPQYLPGRTLLANLLLQQNNAKQALILLQKVNSQPPIQNNAEYYNLLADAYRQSGDLKSAIVVYRQLLSLNSTNGAWWVGLGMCFEALNQFSAATEAYQKAQATGLLSPVLQNFVSSKLRSKK